MLQNSHVLYIFFCSVSLPSQSVQLLLTFFCFQSIIQNPHTHVPSPSQLPSLPYSSFLCRSFQYFHLIFCPMVSSILSFLLCSPELSHSTTMSSCLLCVSQMSLLAQFQLFYLAFLLFYITYQVTHPCLPKS